MIWGARSRICWELGLALAQGRGQLFLLCHIDASPDKSLPIDRRRADAANVPNRPIRSHDALGEVEGGWIASSSEDLRDVVPIVGAPGQVSDHASVLCPEEERWIAKSFWGPASHGEAAAETPSCPVGEAWPRK